jgi:transcriptional regulator with XRE-family HTH domain
MVGGATLRRNDRNVCGARLKLLREHLDLTQEQVAARLAFVAEETKLLPGWIPSRHIVERIEAGDREVTDKDLLVLSLALSVDPAWLLGHPSGKSPLPEKAS